MTNVSLIDEWTAVHVVWGAVAARAGMSLGAYLALSVAYEAVEKHLEGPLFKSKRPESAINVAGDLAAGLVGFSLAR